MGALQKRYDVIRDAIKTYREVSQIRKDAPGTKYRDEDGFHLAKILYLPDKAGKTRTVFCLTWWFQELLNPFHKELYNLLDRIKEDGTSSHDRAAQVVKAWTSEGRQLWSIDLTNATDRFPFWLQREVVAGLKGEQFAELWGRIMHIRAWSEPHKRVVEYKVGQPMGSKTSWAIFALTHHTLLRLLCRFHRVRGQAYVIIGDDIVISNKLVAESYMGLLRDLGVDYSPKKTISPSKASGSVAEFAKRIFKDGTELSPLTSSLLERVWKHRDYPVFLSLLKEMRIKWGQGCDVSTTQLRFHPPSNILFQTLPKVWQQKLLVSIGVLGAGIDASKEGNLYSFPAGELVIPTEDPETLSMDNPWRDYDQLTYLTALHSEVSNTLSGYVELLIFIRKSYHWGELLESRVQGKFYKVPSHPIHGVLTRIEEVIKDVSRGMAEGDLNLARVLDLGLDLRFLADHAAHGRSWESHKRLLERRDRSSLKFWDTVYHNCENPEDMYY
jgi:hypothetical protein